MSVRCPRCGIDLAPNALAWLSSCKRCGGVFAAKSMTKLGPAEGEAARAASAGAAVRPSTLGSVICSICHKKTNREVLRGVEVDRCAEHGFWFDRDEIQHILAGTKPKVSAVAAAAIAGGAAAGVAGAAMASGQLRNDPSVRDMASRIVDGVDIGVDVTDVGVDVVEIAADAAPSVVSGVGELAGGVLEVIAGLFDGL